MFTIIDLFIMFYNAHLIGTKGDSSLRECNVFLSYMFLPAAIIFDALIIRHLLRG